MTESGGTGSGKTTFLNVLSHYIPAEERVITIEDSAELQLQGLPNLVQLETRNSEIDLLMASPGICTDVARLQELNREKEENEAKLNDLYEKWELLSE